MDMLYPTTPAVACAVVPARAVVVAAASGRILCGGLYADVRACGNAERPPCIYAGEHAACTRVRPLTHRCCFRGE